MTRTFDLIVGGSGSAAGTVASRCRTAGWSVAMIDKRPFGGTCALRGCDPKKVLAAGAKPIDLGIPGREHLLTSDGFLELPSLPSSIAFVGGGYISFEFAHVVARAGGRATILHRGQRPLVEFDPDLVERLVRRTCDVGIDVRLGAEVQAIESV